MRTLKRPAPMLLLTAVTSLSCGQTAAPPLVPEPKATMARSVHGYYRKYSPWLESKRLPDGTLPEASLTAAERSRLIELAREFVDSHGGHIPEDATAFIEETDSTYMVAFPVFRSPGDTTRGGDFLVRVHIRKSDFSLLRLEISA